MEKVTLKQLSICKCGYPLFKTYVKLGTVYEVDLDQKKMMELMCGGCGATTVDIPCVWSSNPHGGRPGFLPMAMFEAQAPPETIQ